MVQIHRQKEKFFIQIKVANKIDKQFNLKQHTFTCKANPCE